MIIHCDRVALIGADVQLTVDFLQFEPLFVVVFDYSLDVFESAMMSLKFVVFENILNESVSQVIYGEFLFDSTVP